VCVCVFVSVCGEGCFESCVGILVMCVLVFTVFCIVSFMYIYSYLFCLYKCKDYCHRVDNSVTVSK